MVDIEDIHRDVSNSLFYRKQGRIIQSIISKNELIMLLFLLAIKHDTQCVLCETLHYIKDFSYDLNILVVLIGLVIIFKTQAVSLVTKIWNTITENASTVTG